MKNFFEIHTLFWVALLLCSSQGIAQTEPRRVPATNKAPAQSLGQNLSHNLKQNLNQYQGQVVLLDFWASWCGPCRRSFPWMNDMQARYGERGLTVVAVNLDQQRAAAEKFLKRYPAQFTLWYDPEGTLAKAYKVESMPTSVLLDRQGKIISIHRGFRTKNIDAYEQAIQQAL